MYEKYLDYIPFGRENAIPGHELKTLLGVDDRTMREIVAKLRETYCIVNHQDGEGYYRPSEDDYAAVLGYIAQEKSRAKSINRSLKGAKKWISGQ